MDGWMDGWTMMDRWMDGWMVVGGMDGWMGGWMDIFKKIKKKQIEKPIS